MQKKIIAICGATASGKTALAIEIAQKYKTEILSFDSRQCFQELNIAVAKPTTEELQKIPHYFINSHSINQNVNAAIYEKYALEKLENIFAKNNTVIAVGGTGLYLRALCEGVNAIPEIPILLRKQLQREYENFGLLWLQNEIKKYDNSFINANDLNNVQRMLRALEVVQHTGNSIKFYYKQPLAKRNFIVEKYAIDMPRNILYERINKRVDLMIENGLQNEAEKFLPKKKLNALQTVGYSEWWPFFNSEISLTKTIELLKQHTRNYAKRQITWFKQESNLQWINNITQIH